MAKSVDFAVKVGRLSADVEPKVFDDNNAVVNFSLAMNSSYFDKKTKEWKQGETEWVSCTAWGREAKMMAYVPKGSMVLVIGNQKTESWEAKGQKQQRLKLNCTHVYKVDLQPEYDLKDASGGGEKKEEAAAEGTGF